MVRDRHKAVKESERVGWAKDGEELAKVHRSKLKVEGHLQQLDPNAKSSMVYQDMSSDIRPEMTSAATWERLRPISLREFKLNKVHEGCSFLFSVDQEPVHYKSAILAVKDDRGDACRVAVYGLVSAAMFSVGSESLRGLT